MRLAFCSPSSACRAFTSGTSTCAWILACSMTEAVTFNLVLGFRHYSTAGPTARDVRLLVSGAAHGDAAEAIAADFLGSAEREVQHPAPRIRPAILDGAVDLLAVIEIGDDEDGAERLGAMRAGDFVGLEALAARVPFVFPVDGSFRVVGRRTRDAAHPHLLECLGLGWQRREQQRKRSQPHTQDTATVHHSPPKSLPTGPVMVNALVTNLALKWPNWGTAGLRDLRVSPPSHWPP